MKKHIFIIGEQGCGKTTMIRSALGDKLSYAGGFITEKAYDTSGCFLGFDLYPAAAALGQDGYKGERYLDLSSFPPGHDNEVFRGLGVRLLEESAYYPYVILDEFGGFELLIPQFREALLDVLNSDIPCIGVLKDNVSGDILRQSLGLGDKYTSFRDRLEAALREDEDTLLLSFGNEDDEDILRKLELWVKEYCQ